MLSIVCIRRNIPYTWPSYKFVYLFRDFFVGPICIYILISFLAFFSSLLVIIALRLSSLLLSALYSASTDPSPYIADILKEHYYGINDYNSNDDVWKSVETEFGLQEGVIKAIPTPPDDWINKLVGELTAGQMIK